MAATGSDMQGGRHHWLLQRTTAIANLFLFTWLAVSLALMPDFGFTTIVGWLSGTVPSLAMALLVVSSFWHARLGLQVVIEDYVHDAGLRLAAMMVVNLAAFAGAAAGLAFILRILVHAISGEMAAGVAAQMMAAGGR